MKSWLSNSVELVRPWIEPEGPNLKLYLADWWNDNQAEVEEPNISLCLGPIAI